MKISLSGSGSIAKEYLKINPEAHIFSFRKLNPNEIKEVIINSDVIIHNSGNTDFNSLTLFEDNFLLTKKICDIILKEKPKVKFINIGSMSFLNSNGYLPIKKMSDYAYSKYLAEIHALTFLPNCQSIRFSNIFYKNKDKDGLSKIIYEAKNNNKIYLFNRGVAKRDFIPINIAVKYLDYITKNPSDQIINICSGIETSFYEISQILLKYLNAEIIYEEAPKSKILSQFKRSLPKIEFSLEEEIKNYLCEL